LGGGGGEGIGTPGPTVLLHWAIQSILLYYCFSMQYMGIGMWLRIPMHIILIKLDSGLQLHVWKVISIPRGGRGLLPTRPLSQTAEQEPAMSAVPYTIATERENIIVKQSYERGPTSYCVYRMYNIIIGTHGSLY
jgi:hypothetical protein